MKVTDDAAKSRAVAWWLITGVVMLMIQVVLGGITRLTGSGLSITEWQPILGTLPPMNEQAWQAAFEKYKEIGQYKQINFYFSLEDFKSIYFWEWFHRDWARLIAVVFVIGFIYFLVKRYFKKEMIVPFIVLFILGGLQGLIGWLMVSTGLNDESLFVSHFSLAIHFMSAMVLICYTLWFALKLLVPEYSRVRIPEEQKLAAVIFVLLLVQLVYGAFMAGLKAAVSAPTWPLINGKWIPDSFGSSYTSDHLTVHFIHRGLAYLIFILTLVWWWKGRRAVDLFGKVRPLPLLVTFVQVVLGILTVLFSTTPKALLWLGALHQFTAMLLLLSWVTLFYFYARKRITAMA